MNTYGFLVVLVLIVIILSISINFQKSGISRNTDYKNYINSISFQNNRNFSNKNNINNKLSSDIGLNQIKKKFYIH